MRRAGKRGSGGRDGWRGGTKEERRCDYEDLVRRELHRHIHVACQSTVFVAPKAGVLCSHISLGTRPHTHTHAHTDTLG